MKTIRDDNVLDHVDEYDLVVIPACSTVKDGTLDMSVGINKSVATMWNGIDKYFGKVIDRVCGSNGEFWFLRHEELPIGLLQVKTRVDFDATPPVALDGLDIIRRIAEFYDDMKIAIVIPKKAINKKVQNELNAMPDNVVRYM